MIFPMITATRKGMNLIFLYNILMPMISGNTGRKQNIAKRKVANLPVLVSMYLSRLNESLTILFWFLKYVFILFTVRWNRCVLSMDSYMASFLMTRFCTSRTIIADNVATHTLMIDKVRGLTFCKSRKPVIEYPNGLNIVGPIGAKNVTIHKMKS